jgi:nucleoside-diphosphate-sugar epimerase
MRILIIGGTRFIGPHVALQLVEAGHDVTVYHRGQTVPESLPDSVNRILSPHAGIPVVIFPPEVLQIQPHVVIHMIPMGERDATAAIQAFRGFAHRLVALSSGDVYRAYGRFSGIEPGPIEESPLTEDSALRYVLHPYRSKASSPEALEHWYEKILVERVVLNDPQLPGVVLRLPKVYGPGDNADLATVHGFRNHPSTTALG